MKGLYIHIPFCDHICTYCDFPKLYGDLALQDDYLEALLEELQMYRQKQGFDSLETVYLGGGTPTALSDAQLKRLLEELKKTINLPGLKEFSIEANPENLTAEKISLLLDYGINRVSLGVQTFDDGLLKIIGRTHSAASAETAVLMLKERGMPRINIDLIYGIPGQTLAQLDRDLEIVIRLGVDHVSAYSLILEKHTKMYLDYMNDRLDLADNEVEAQMFERVIETFKKSGFSHYEISNFTKADPSYHNLLYWQNAGYIGAGLGAHGYIGNRRYSNTRSITSYIRNVRKGNLPMISEEELDLYQQVEEELFLGLRLLGGVDLKKAGEKFRIDLGELYKKPLMELISGQYIIQKGSRIALTHKGLLMANLVFEQFLLSE